MLHSDLPTASEREAYFGRKRRLERALLAGNRLMQPRHSALNLSNSKAECTDAEVSMRIVGSEQGSSSLWWREKAPERIMCIEADAEGADGHAVALLHAPASRERPAGRHPDNPASSDDATVNAPPQPVPNGLTSQLGHPDNSASSVEAVLYAPLRRLPLSALAEPNLNGADRSEPGVPLGPHRVELPIPHRVELSNDLGRAVHLGTCDGYVRNDHLLSNMQPQPVKSRPQIDPWDHAMRVA